MGFRRDVLPSRALEGVELTACMLGVGFRLAGGARRDANVEDVLLFASIEGMDKERLRTLALLTTWLSIHSSTVNADRLTALANAQSSARVRAYWAGVGTWLGTDRRFARLSKLYRTPRVDLLEEGTEFHIARRGEDARFAGGPLRVPAGVLRDRPEDIAPREEVARIHRAYRWRVLVGPSYRADMLALLERQPNLSLTDLAHQTYGSIATAFRVKQDWATLGARRLEFVRP